MIAKVFSKMKEMFLDLDLKSALLKFFGLVLLAAWIVHTTMRFFNLG